jgi:catechol 2,3-dioxygenase
MNANRATEKTDLSVSATRRANAGHGGLEAPTFQMHRAMRLGAPTLRTRDLPAALRFYTNVMGLRIGRKGRDRNDDLETVELGFGGLSAEPLLVLKGDQDAKQAPNGAAGLYHYAVLVPDRKSLASTFMALGEKGLQYEGFADHQVSESLYLHDVERNGIEIYADRPRSQWPEWKKISAEFAATGDASIIAPLTQPLDIDSVLAQLSARERTSASSFPRGARIGHVHLRVTNLERSVRFYNEKLGLDIMMNLGPIGAAFLSAGGYHHHFGLNTWHSLGGSHHREGEAGLEEVKVIVPDKGVLKALEEQFDDSKTEKGALIVRDPDGTRVSIVAAIPAS